MSVHDNREDGSLVPAGRRELAPVASANSLVSRALADLAEPPLLTAGELIRPKPNNAISYIDRGSVWLAKKEYDKAITDFNDAVCLDPKSAAAYNLRGLAWYSKKEYDTAITDFCEAIRLNATYAGFFSNRGTAWRDKEAYDNAIKDYTQALQLDPANADTYKLRGIAWWNNQDYDNAISDLNQAIRLDPNNSALFRIRGMLWLAKKEPDQATWDFNHAIRDEAVRLDPMLKFIDDDGWALSCLAEANAEAGRFEQAVRLQTKALGYPWTAGNEFRERLELYKQNKPLRQDT